MLFLVDEWIGIDKIAALPGHEDLDSETLQFILEEAGKFCSNELLPINREGDEHGAAIDKGVVTTARQLVWRHCAAKSHHSAILSLARFVPSPWSRRIFLYPFCRMYLGQE